MRRSGYLFVLVSVLHGCGPSTTGPGESPGGEVDGAADAQPGPPDARPNGDDIHRPDAAPPCESLLAMVRDFRAGHPDFESFTGDEVFPGIVETELGADGKPVYAPAGATPHTTGPAEFDQWYRDVSGVNIAVPTRIQLTQAPSGAYVFDDTSFFPVDGEGFADTAMADDGMLHNFHFTTEVNTSFVYEAGQSFTFRGDDDLWLFVNGRLALDLGGLHQPASGTIDMDAQAAELGLVLGQRYAMDIFHAERHTTGSNFHIETTIDCFIIP